jgi:peptidoglycan hydrolase-like protein with peptidoglycan-binding domain
MLKFINNQAGRPYLSGLIDGSHGPNTQSAINAFQADHGGDQTPIAAGVMTPGGNTVMTMSRLLPANRSDLRVLTGQRVVYLGRLVGDANAATRAIRTNTSLRAVFRNQVAQLIDTMYTQHHLVLSLTPTGGRRTFAEQAAIAPPASFAGPGESNHNYGNAVDLGFNGTTWLRRDGTSVTDDHWLRALERYEARAATAFWDARDAIALHPPSRLFRLRFERIHLQDFDEATTSSGRSLAAHLTAVGAWGWRTGHYDQGARDWHYACDLGGTTGNFVEVGTADQIWAGNATVTAAEIIHAGWVRPGGVGAATPPITPADIRLVQATLQADFQAADQAWARWMPVP